MNVHKNAPLTPEGRLRMVRRVFQDRAPHSQVALEFSTTTRTVTKWVGRYLEAGRLVQPVFMIAAHDPTTSIPGQCRRPPYGGSVCCAGAAGPSSASPSG